MEEIIRCGFGKREITPPLGSPLVGQYRPRVAKGVLDPVCVRATMFESGGKTALMMALDICLLSKPLGTDIREMVSAKIGLPMDAIHINASHTHTGPLTGKDFASDTYVDPSYLEFLKDQALAACEEAKADLAPAKIFFGETRAEGISFIRRFRMKDGSTKTNPPTLSPEIDRPLGEPNEEVRYLKIEREGKGEIFLVSFGTHPDTVGGEYVSADWPGYLCSTLESAIPGSRCMFLLAPQGDVNHCNRFAERNGIVGPGKEKGNPKGDMTHARYMGRVIAGQVLATCDRAKELSGSEIRFESLDLLLPTNRDNSRLEEATKVYNEYLAAYEKGEKLPPAMAGGRTMSVPEARRIVRMQNEPEFYSFTAFALRIGNFVFAGLPGEPFTEIARRIYEKTPFENMILSCQTNASCGYIGTSRAYDEGGYETLTSSYKRGVDDVMVEGMLSLLEKLK